MNPSQTSYDQIPYRSSPFPQTRPARLAAVAKLFGLDAPPAESCRVLELGCAAGGNLIPMAHDYPDSRFVGIDASSRQIADGWPVIQALRLKNIDLKHLDIAHVDASFGEFDYVICHGVFSWVPPAVQDKIVEICRRHLAPNGVAYVSYNTYPGWHVRGIVRDMMRYHGMQFGDPAMRLAQAKALVQFVVDSARVQNSKYKELLKDEFDIVAAAEDSYLHHDHLEENNRPLYFHEFAQKLAVNGLQYLGEAEFTTMVSTNFAPEIAQTLQRIGAHDILQMEQYMDFVRCRYFRQTLICNRAVALNRSIGPDVVERVLLASPAAPVNPTATAGSEEPVDFQIAGGAVLKCRRPLTKAAMTLLGRAWPAAIPFDALYTRAKEEAAGDGPPTDDATREGLAKDLLVGMAAGVVEWRLTPGGFVTTIGEKPVASALARQEADRGGLVTNLRGESLTLDEIHRQLLRRLDGRHGREGLIDALVAFLKDSGHTLRRDGDDTPVTDEAEVRTVLGPAIDKALVNLAKFCLLTG